VPHPLDSLGFCEQVAGLPEQLTAAHEAAGSRTRDAPLPGADRITGVLVAGLGGSGIAGDVLAAVGLPSLPVPVVVARHLRLPAWVGPGTLVFACSYSGETEETLAMATAAVEAGAALVTVASGGALARLGTEAGVLHLPCPPGLMPRAALGALVAPLFVVAFRTGLLPEAHALLVAAQEQLARRRDACLPAREGPANPARTLATRIGTRLPIIHGTGALGAVAAYRWKCDLNENAKTPALWAAHPELDHNEVCGFERFPAGLAGACTLVELRHGYEHPRLAARVAATRELAAGAVAEVCTVEAEGEGRLAQLLDLMYLGDWTSCHLALDHGVDPGPIEAIRRLKAHVERS